MIQAVVPIAQADATHGGKAANLAWLIERGYRVPTAVVVASPDADGLDAWTRPDRRYAVRSSASVEDTAEHSFAGQFETVLDVGGHEAMGRAIRRVLGSAHDERLVPYLEHTGVAREDIRMHAIVQEMVAAQVSGVAFSRNPLTGLADVLIEAVAGSGEALVSGRATPQRWIRHWGDWMQRPEGSDLPEAVAGQLADLVGAVADAWGAPVDVEWVWDGTELWLLQVRPMTAADVPVYSNRIAREFLPGIVPPLVWSINIPLVNRAWLRLFTSLVGPLDLQPEDLSRQFAYRAYFNMKAVGDIFEAMSMPRDLLEVLMGIEGGQDRPTFRPRPGVARHLPRMTRMAWRLLRYERELDRLMPKAQAAVTRIQARDLAAMSDRELVEQVGELERIVGHVAFANIVAPLLFNAYGTLLRRRLERRGIDAHGVDVGAGDPELEAYDPRPHLARLAERVAALDGPTRDRVLGGELDLVDGGTAFLERFGHVSDSGNDFSHVPWREDPDRLAPLLSAPGTDVVGAAGRGAASQPRLSRVDRMLERRTARFRLERERVSYTYTRGYGHFRPTVLEIARRLVERGRLDERDDVFYVTRDEMVAGLLDGHRRDLRGPAAERRAEIERLAEVEMPEIIFGDEFEPAPPADPDQRLTGIPSSRGIHRATARVIGGVDEAGRVRPGDVVVIPWSDIGWTPLLARAGAIVAESGGLLSHSSIVAREFGIPCVVSVPGAMRIPDGSVVRVDGYTGEVQWEVAA